MLHSYESNLLVVNATAGTGKAKRLANEISCSTNSTDLRTVYFQDLIALHPIKIAELLVPVTSLFVLGGDGSTFTLLELLTRTRQEYPESPEKTLVALGSGGENVVSKHMGTFKNKVAVVRSVFDGQHAKTELDFGCVTSEDGEKNLFFWNVHAGFSSAVLHEIELLRSQGAGDISRRYGAVLRTLKNFQGSQDVIYTLNGIEQKPVRDFGIISTQLPYWTSKIQLETPEVGTALLHTIATPEVYAGSSFQYSSRLLLEMITLTLGLPLRRVVLTQVPLNADDIVTVYSAPQALSVDSEVTAYQQGTITLPQRNNKTGVSVARLAH